MISREMEERSLAAKAFVLLFKDQGVDPLAYGLSWSAVEGVLAGDIPPTEIPPQSLDPLFSELRRRA